MAKKFFKSGVMLTIVGLAMRTVAMLFGAYISRTVGAEGTGIYTLVMTVYSFALTLATSGIGLTVTRLVACAIGEGREEDLSRILRGSLLFSLFFGLLSSVGLFFGANIIGEAILSDARTVGALRVLSISLIPAALASALSGYFVGVRRVGFNAVASVFAQLMRIAVTTLILVCFIPDGSAGAVIGLCIGISVTEILAFLLIFFEFLYDWRKNGVKSNGGSPMIRAVSRTALPLAFSAYVRSLLLNVEHILIPKKLRQSGESPSEAYSHYGILHGMALPLVTFPMSPLSSFAGLLVPEFAEDMAAGNNDRMRRVASRALNTTLCYSAVCAVFLYAFAEELGYAVYDSFDAGYYISTLALVVPIMYLDHVTDSILKGVGEQVFSMWVNISDSLLSVILVCLLIPRMGIMGYAAVIVIMEAFNFSLSYMRLRTKVRPKIMPMRAIVFPALFAVTSAKIASSVLNFSGSCAPVLWLTMKIVFALCICLACLSLTDLLLQRVDKRKAKKGFISV